MIIQNVSLENTSDFCLMYVLSAIAYVTRTQSTPNFPKNEHFSSPDTQTYVCVSGGKKMFVFRKIWRALFSCNTRFEIRSFALLPTVNRSQLGVCEFLGNFDFFSEQTFFRVSQVTDSAVIFN